MLVLAVVRSNFGTIIFRLRRLGLQWLAQGKVRDSPLKFSNKAYTHTSFRGIRLAVTATATPFRKYNDQANLTSGFHFREGA